jgi:hypothetical protein
MKAGEMNIFENEQVQLIVPETSLYDSISFSFASKPNPVDLSFSPQYSLHRYTVPVHLPYTVKIKPDKAIPYPLRERMVMLHVEKDERTVRKARWELGWYVAQFRAFGYVQLMADDQPPVLQTPGLADGANIRALSKIIVTATDNYEAVRNFRAELDGKWLMFSQRGRTYTYKMDGRMTPGPHELKLQVEDEAGNKTEKIIRFTR